MSKVNESQISSLVPADDRDGPLTFRNLVVIIARSAQDEEEAILYRRIQELCPESMILRLEPRERDGRHVDTIGSTSEAQSIGLIDSYASKHGFERADVILIGIGEFGPVAAIFAAKYGFRNTLIVGEIRVPTTQVDPSGWSVQQVYEEQILKRVLENTPYENLSFYFIINARSSSSAASLGLVPSEFGRYQTQIILTGSRAISTEVDLISYNRVIISSIINLLAHTIEPSIGMASNGDDFMSPRARRSGLIAQRETKQVVTRLYKPKLEADRLYPQGYVAIKGFEAPEYSSQRVSLDFVSPDSNISKPLGTLRRPELSAVLYDRTFIDYTAAAFASGRHEGISLLDLPLGNHELHVRVVNGAVSAESPVCTESDYTLYSSYGRELYKIRSKSGTALLSKYQVPDATSPDVNLSIDDFTITGSKLRLSGQWRQEREWAPNSDLGAFVIIGEGDASQSHRLETQSINSSSLHTGMTAAQFHAGGDGIEIGPRPSGNYSVRICLIANSTVASANTEFRLNASSSYAKLEPRHIGSTLPVVGVLGSCVTRDNFNSRVMPDWKSHLSLGPTHYQMSLVSLMAKPVDHPPASLNHMNDHDRSVTERDFSKVFLSEFASNPPETLIVDLFSDARFNCIRYSNSFVTDNTWKLPTAVDFYKSISQCERIGMHMDAGSFVPIFRDSCERLKQFIEKHSPRTQVFLNQARAVDQYVDDGVRVYFSQEANRTLNAYWRELDEVFIDVFEPVIIDAMTVALGSTRTHPWGPANVHYENLFYRRFRTALLRELGMQSDHQIVIPSD